MIFPCMSILDAFLWHGMLQLSSLTELDISGNDIHSTIQPQLQVSTVIPIIL